METIKAISLKLEELAGQAGNIAGSLAALENALFFAEEREDRDLTKPYASAAHILEQITTALQGEIMEAAEALERMGKAQDSGQRGH